MVHIKRTFLDALSRKAHRSVGVWSVDCLDARRQFLGALGFLGIDSKKSLRDAGFRQALRGNLHLEKRAVTVQEP